MEKQDLIIAKNRLSKAKGLTLTIAKNGEIIFETSSHGISGFLEAVEKLGDRLKGASVADKIVGKAIALLCVYTCVKMVYAVTLSREAKAFFEKHKVYHEWNELVENILNFKKVGICPFEKLAMEISNPKEAYKRLKALQNSLNMTDDEKDMNGEHEQFISGEEEELKHIREKNQRIEGERT